MPEGVGCDGRLHGVGARKGQEDEPDPEREDRLRHGRSGDVFVQVVAAVDAANDAGVEGINGPR